MIPPRAAISAIFLVNGFVLANWLARIPGIARQLELNNAQLGTALLGMAIGALLAFPVTGYLISRFGSARVTIAFGVALGLVLPLLALASSLPLLFLALVLFGASNGGMDVAMNAQGVEVESRLDKPIINSLHGFFSLGGVIGATLGGAVAAAGIIPSIQFVAVALLAVTGILWLRRALVPDTEKSTTREATPTPVFAFPPRSLWGLGAVAFCASVGEGAMADWSALYLRESLGTGAGTAALGYAAFSLAMLVGRFSGDSLVSLLGSVRMIQSGGVVAALGLALGLAFHNTFAVLFGFSAVGLGLSVVAPLVFRTAGTHPTIPRGTAVAAVATMAYSGFLAGPPLLGWLAQISSLRLALTVVVVLSIMIVALSAVAQGQVRPLPAAQHN